jgi:hypothetical protein
MTNDGPGQQSNELVESKRKHHRNDLEEEREVNLLEQCEFCQLLKIDVAMLVRI